MTMMIPSQDLDANETRRQYETRHLRVLQEVTGSFSASIRANLSSVGRLLISVSSLVFIINLIVTNQFNSATIGLDRYQISKN